MEVAAIHAIDTPVSRYCFGCEQLGGTDWGAFSESEAIATVSCAVDAGVNFFDTADVYGLGQAEERLARALGPKRHTVVIATKVGVAWEARDGRARTYTDCSPARLEIAVENSLRRLKLDRLPLLQLHRYDASVPLEDSLGALAELRAAGKIGAVGYSNFPLDALRRAHALLPASTYQLSLNLLHHAAAAASVEFCRTQDIAVLAYGVLAHGLLTGKYGRDSRFDASDRRHRLPDFQGPMLEKNLRTIAAIERIAAALGRPIAEVALRWALGYQGVTCAIVGQKSVAQLERNLRALEWGLSAGQWAALSALRGKDVD